VSGHTDWHPDDVCRASCCCGYATMGPGSRPNGHDAQAILDRWGFINGHFGSDHARVRDMVLSLVLRGSDVVQRVVSALIRDGLVAEPSGRNVGSNGHH
jgi:hypothetical protein